MDVFIFLLLIVICIGSIYIVHKYFGKNEFYLLAIIFSILSFLLSFKIVHIFGININNNIIFEAGIVSILYYFVNRYNESETKKYNMSILISTIVCGLFLLFTSLMIPSIYDEMSEFYADIFISNIVIFIFYPLSLFVLLILSGYSFKELKGNVKNKNIKLLLTLLGIVFIDTLLFVYFSYAFIIRYDKAIFISIDNYVIRTLLVILYIFSINMILKVKKVKE